MRILIAGSVSCEIPNKYIKEAEKFTDYLIENKCDVICCADKRGVIGSIYNKIKTKCNIVLAMPKVYMEHSENIEQDVDKITNTINERTDYIIQNSDVAIFFPGGIGTIYELLSAIETRRAGEHKSKIIIVNIDGFFNDLLEMLDKIYKEKFAKEINRDEYNIVENIKETIDCIENM